MCAGCSAGGVGQRLRELRTASARGATNYDVCVNQLGHAWVVDDGSHGWSALTESQLLYVSGVETSGTAVCVDHLRCGGEYNHYNRQSTQYETCKVC